MIRPSPSLIFPLLLILSSCIKISKSLSFGAAIPLLFGVKTENINNVLEKSLVKGVTEIKGDKRFITELSAFRRHLLPEKWNEMDEKISKAISISQEDIFLPLPKKVEPLPSCSKSYNIKGIIADGKGDKNIVFLVEEILSKRMMVWKLFGKENDFIAERMFFEEAQAHGGNPNIVRAECVMREDSSLIDHSQATKKIKNQRKGIILELVKGGGQDSLVWSRKRATTLQQLRDSSKILLNTLKWIHSIGWIHADLKCGNVMINDEGEPIIIDFGYSFKRRIGGKMGKGNWSIKAPELNRKLLHPPTKVPPATYLTEAIDMWAFGSIMASWYGYKYLPRYRAMDGQDSALERYYIMTKIIYGRDYKMGTIPREFPLPLRELLYLLNDPDFTRRTFNQVSTLKVLKDLAFWKQ